MKKVQKNITNELEVALTEYRTLKDEEKTIFSFEFTALGIWLAFLGVLLNSLFTNFDSIQKDNHLVLFIGLLIPGVSSLFGIIWLDLVARFIKEANYIYILEEKINQIIGENVINYEHYILKLSERKSFFKRTNMILYYLIIGAILLIPFLMMIIVILYHKDWWKDTNGFEYEITKLLLYIFEIVTLFFVHTYVVEILSYKKAQKNKNHRFSMPVKIFLIFICILCGYIIIPAGIETVIKFFTYTFQKT